MKSRYLIAIMLSALFASSAPGSAQEAVHPSRNIILNSDVKLPPASTKPNITYAADIKPILDANCTRCHVSKQAKLHLDSLTAILQGTENTRVVVPGAPAKSWLVREIIYSGKETNSVWMPPQHNKAKLKRLSPEEIGLIIGWIQQGAN